MSVSGVVVSVSPDWRGGTLEVDALSTDTVLTVGDAIDFDEDGGWLVLADESSPREYVAVDFDAETVTLAAAAGAAFEAGLPVVLWDPTVGGGGSRVVEYVAEVRLHDDTGTTLAVVEHALVPSAGAANLVGASVSLGEDDEGGWFVASVDGRQPFVDGTFIDPDTLPAAETGPDGIPPGSSPTPEVIGGVGVLHVRWSPVANHDPVTYEVHLSTSTGFTPDASTLVGEVDGGAFTARELTDGTALAYGTTYYVRLVAKDVDGAAAPGVEASGEMHQVTGPDVSAEYVYAGTVNYGNLIGGPIDADGLVASTIKTAESGARVELSSSGLTVHDSTGAPVTELKGTGSTFRGAAALTSATFSGPAVFGGTENEFQPGAKLTLEQGYGPPTSPPTWSEGYETVALDNEEMWVGFAELDATNWVGLLAGQSDGSGGYRLVTIGKATGTLTVIGESGTSLDPLGLAVSGDRILVFRLQGNSLDVAPHSLSGPLADPSFIISGSEFPGTPSDTGFRDAAFGWDAVVGKAMMAWPDASAGATRVAHFDLVTDGGTVTDLTLGINAGRAYTGVVREGSRYYLGSHGETDVRVFDTAGARVDTEWWDAPQPPAGLAHDGTNFWQINTSQLTRYEDDAGPTGWVISYEWYDSVNNVGTGTNSGAGDVLIYPRRRAQVTLVSDTIPGDGAAGAPDQARFYVLRTDTDFLGQYGWLQGAASTPGRTTETLAVPTQTGVQDTGTNGFAAVAGSEPAEIVSGATYTDGTPKWRLKADGSWHLGRMSRQESLSSFTTIADPFYVSAGSFYTASTLLVNGETWHVVGAAGEPGYMNGWGPAPDGVEFRLDAAGTVHLIGRVWGGPTTSTVFVLPVGYRPVKQYRALCEAQGSGNTANSIVRDTGEVDINLWTGAPSFISLSYSFSTL